MVLNIKKISKKILIAGGIALVVALILNINYQNNSLQITKLPYENEKIPVEFDGFTICQISDLHNKNFGKNQSILIEKIKENAPDIIVVSGDLIDRRKYNLDIAMQFILQAVEIAPVYYVPGNHEAWSGKYEEVKASLFKAGVIVLDNEATTIDIDNSSISVFGLKDPNFYSNIYKGKKKTTELLKKLKEWSSHEGFSILLSHRPDLFDMYVENNMDLVFSGHAHGGQFRLPFIGGLYVPDQGFFPKYTSGFYTNENTTMYVSRGLGNSVFPIRINNRPEIVFITLKNPH